MTIPAGPAWLPDLVVAAGLAHSKGEAKRLAHQAAIMVDGRVVMPSETFQLSAGETVTVTKRRGVGQCPDTTGPCDGRHFDPASARTVVLEVVA